MVKSTKIEKRKNEKGEKKVKMGTEPRVWQYQPDVPCTQGSPAVYGKLHANCDKSKRFGIGVPDVITEKFGYSAKLDFTVSCHGSRFP